MVALRHSRVRAEGLARHRDLVPRGTYARYLPSPAEAEAEAEAAAAAAAPAVACVARSNLPASRPGGPPHLAWAPRARAGSDKGQEGMARTFRAFAVGEGDGAPTDQGVACGLDPGLCDALARIRQLLSAGPGAVATTAPALRVQSQARQTHAARA
jgi:hypothetical protein